MANESGLLKGERNCRECSSVLCSVPWKQYKDGICWRCNNPNCSSDRPRTNIRKGSFFEGFNLPYLKIIKVFIRWSLNNKQTSIVENLGINDRTYKKIIQKFLSLIQSFDFKDNKLGGPNHIVQIDETALNRKVKAHRGRAPTNKTDTLCIVEFKDQITRVFVYVIPNKKVETIIPITYM